MVLQDEKKRVGLVLPDFETYYKEAKRIQVRDWILLKKKGHYYSKDITCIKDATTICGTTKARHSVSVITG